MGPLPRQREKLSQTCKYMCIISQQSGKMACMYIHIMSIYAWCHVSLKWSYYYTRFSCPHKAAFSRNTRCCLHLSRMYWKDHHWWPHLHQVDVQFCGNPRGLNSKRGASLGMYYSSAQATLPSFLHCSHLLQRSLQVGTLPSVPCDCKQVRHHVHTCMLESCINHSDEYSVRNFKWLRECVCKFYQALLSTSNTP